MGNKRIWIVTELFYPDETAVAYIFTRIAVFLSSEYNVCVICGPEFYDKDKKSFIDNINIPERIEIHRTRTVHLDKNSILQRTIRIVILSLRLGFLMIRNISKGETVILSTNPALLLLIVRLLKYFKHFRLHILVHDVFPENTIPAKVIKNDKSVIYKFLKLMFDRAYACADQLIVIGRDMNELILRKVSKFKHVPIISIVPNWTNPTDFKIEERQTKGDKIILQYAGNIGRVQGLKELIEAFNLSNNNRLHLNIRGTGALYGYIEDILRKYCIGNISLMGGFSRNDESKILRDCDIGIVSLSRGMYGLGVPSKTYHLLSAGKPILYIGEPETEIALMITEHRIGWSLNIRNQVEIVDFFKNLDKVEIYKIRSMGKKARLLAENIYNETSILQKFAMEIKKVSENND